MASSSSTIKVTSTPFAAFPHIVILSNGRTIEVSCPSCNGNAAGSRAPFSFFEGVNGMTSHMARIHKDAKLSPSQYLASSNLRILSQAEIDAIKAGHWKDVITKRKATKTDGELAKEFTSNKAIAIPYYPIIIKLKDNRYVQLMCTFCNGNAQTRKGQDRKKGDNLAYFQGASALRSHIRQAHPGQLETAGIEKITNRWVIANCGIPVSEDFVESLKRDLALSTIPMIKAKSDEPEAAEDEDFEIEEDEEPEIEQEEEPETEEDEESETDEPTGLSADALVEAMLAIESDED